MKTAVEKKVKQSTVLSIVFIILMVVIFGVLLIYFQNAKSVLEYETNIHLKDNAEQVCDALDYRVDIQMERLQTITFTYQKYMEMNNAEGAQEYLESRAKKYMFRHLEVLTPYGENGQWKAYSRTYPFQQSLKGKQEVAYIEKSPIDGKGVVLYAVPYVVNGEVKAIMVGERTKEKVAEILHIEDFSGKGKYIIVDRDGNVLAYNKNVENMDKIADLYELLLDSKTLNSEEIIDKIKEDIKKRKGDNLIFKIEEKNILLNYSPLKSTEWTLFSMVEESVLSDNSSMFIRQTVVVIALIEGILMVLVFSLVRNNRIYSNNLEKIAYVDPITQGNTLARFEQLYKEALKDSSKQYALITLDIDQFKLINDIFGSREGDKTLKYIHDKISQHKKPGEILARGQADVFCILEEVVSEKQLQEEFQSFVEELNQSFSDSQKDKYSYKLAVSAGIYVLENNNIPLIIAMDRATVARKKKETDRGNYEGKISTCYFYSELDRRNLLTEKEIINHMETALTSGEFEVYLQPKCDAVNHRVRGAEALIRWNDPEKGLVLPKDFIPIFEKTGFIVKIDLYVFDRCCRLVRKWMDEGKELLTISINLSRMHFLNRDFLEPFIKIREKYQVPASCFEMEVTETVICQDVKMITKYTDKIHEAGFACSLDDFGSGYSSLNILKNINVDVIKLDRAFFEKALDKKGKIIITSIIALAHELHMKTVAEGIETFDQVAYLKEMKCDLIQGYVFSRPIPIPEFEKML